MFIFEWLSHIYHVYWIIVKCKYLSGRYDITNCHLFIIQHKLQSMSHPMYFVYLLKIVIKGLEGEFLWRTFWQFFGYPSWLSILVIKYYWNHTSEMLFKSILLHVCLMKSHTWYFQKALGCSDFDHNGPQILMQKKFKQIIDWRKCYMNSIK